jgi:DNA-3-methyladenine glycosylase II
MPDAEMIERLTQVRGVGPWTVEMFLIFRLGRPDVLSATDYGVRKGYALTFQRLPKLRPLEAADLPKPEVLLKRGKRWAPFRSVACWYLWRACDLAQSLAKSGLQ